MKLFKRRRSARQPVTGYQILDTVKMLQRFLLDCRISESQQLSTLLGLPPMDADDALKEKLQSDERIRRAMPLIPIVSILTSALTSSIVEYMSTMSGGLFEAEESEAILDLFNRVALANAIGVVTTLEDIGFVHYPHYLED